MEVSKKLAVFASGNGSNAVNLFQYFREKGNFQISLIITNNPEAGIIAKAEKLGIPIHVWKYPMEMDELKPLLEKFQIEGVILAGYLKLLPSWLIEAYPDRILNIHPALLPAYGGKGMYGDRVHRAVIENKESKSGITIHLVTSEYDKGRILFQKSISLAGINHSEALATGIHELEYAYFPGVVNAWFSTLGL